MALEQLAELLASANMLRVDVARLLSIPAADGTFFSSSEILTGVDGSRAELETVLSFVFQGIENIVESKNTLLIPRIKIEAMDSRLRSYIEHMSAIQSYLAKDGGPQQVLSSTDHKFVYATGQQADLSGHFKQIAADCDALLNSWLTLRAAVSSPKFRDFSDALKLLTDRQADLDRSVMETQAAQKLLKRARSEAENATKAVEDLRNEASRMAQLSSEDRKTLSERTAEGAQKVEVIKSALAEAEKLQALVDAYEGEFSEFDASLASRKTEFVKSESQLKSLFNDLEQQHDDVSRLILQAKDMLAGATNAGLAGTYSRRSDELKASVKRARWAYYFSVFILSVLSLPMATYILPKELFVAIVTKFPVTVQDIVSTSRVDQTTADILAHVVARGIILIPGILLVRFSSGLHERLFRLLEHYQYKYSLAASVDGFKRQSPEWSDEIAAATFFELTANPANSMDVRGHDTRHPNKFMEALLRKLDGRSGEASSARHEAANVAALKT